MVVVLVLQEIMKINLGGGWNWNILMCSSTSPSTAEIVQIVEVRVYQVG
jgi:hypothetical protein